jgi:hypothetical protein
MHFLNATFVSQSAAVRLEMFASAEFALQIAIGSLRGLKVRGHRTYGPTIRFFQATKGSPIKFRPEWIDAFIAQHSFDPHPVAQPEKTSVRPKAPIGDNAGLDKALLTLPKRPASKTG